MPDGQIMSGFNSPPDFSFKRCLSIIISRACFMVSGEPARVMYRAFIESYIGATIGFFAIKSIVTGAKAWC